MAGACDPRCPQETDLNQGRGSFYKKEVRAPMTKREMWKTIAAFGALLIFILLGCIFHS
jgi:hypothetical protein